MAQPEQDWEQRQEAAFTKWINSALHSKRDQTAAAAGRTHVENLAEDLGDGLILAELLETLAAPRKIERYNEKRNNLAACFRIMRQEKVELERNIGPQDVYEGNKTLILGLIWTLIRHYQIRSTGKDTKIAMLTWVKYLVPDQSIRNFSSNWNDGIALCALINRIRPDLCPNYASLDRSRGLENCRLGMKLAEENLNIPRLIEPEDLNSPKADERIVMTYLSSFCQLVNKQLLQWIQKTIPNQNITNLKADWSSGINLACLVNAINPGSFPEWQGLDPSSARANLERAMKSAEVDLGVKPIITVADLTITASKISDPDTTELFVATYLLQFQNPSRSGKVEEGIQSDPSKCKVYGDVIDHPDSPVDVVDVIDFKVDTANAGKGELTVTAINDSNESLKVVHSKDESTHTHTITIHPDVKGKHWIRVEWSTHPIPGSPYTFEVSDHRNVAVYLPNPKENMLLVGKTFQFTVDPQRAGKGQVVARAKLESGKVEEFDQAQCDDKVFLTYEPKERGTMQLLLTFNGKNIVPDHFNPCIYEVADPSTLEVIPPKGSGMLQKPIRFEITGLSERNKQVLAYKAMHTATKRIAFIKVECLDGETAVAQFTPTKLGEYEVTAQVSETEQHVKGSPFKISVANPEGCKITSEIPQTIAVGSHEAITVDTAKAGPGEISFSASSLDDKPTNFIECELEATGPTQQQIILTGMRSGKCNLRLNWAGYSIPRMPIEITVVDPTKCIFLDPPPKYLHSGTPVEIRVSTKDAGPGVLDAHTSQPDILAAKVNPVNDNSFVLQLSPTAVGTATVQLTLNKISVPSCPFTVHVVDPSKCNLLDSIPATVQVGQSVKFKVDTQAAGAGELTMLFPGAEESPIVEHSIDKQESGTYEITLTGKRVGETKVELQWSGYTVPDSAQKLFVTTDQNAPSLPDKITCSGEGLRRALVGKVARFEVDTSGAGNGKFEVNIMEMEAGGKTIDANITHNGDHHSISYTPTSSVNLRILVKWNEKAAPFTYIKANQVRVLNPTQWSLKHNGDIVTVNEEASFEITGPETDVDDFSMQVSTSASAEQLTVARKGSSFVAYFTPTEVDTYTVSVTCVGEEVQGSPLVLHSADPSKCKAYGDVIDHPDCVDMVGGIEFQVDTANAGKGELTITAINDSNESLKVVHSKDESTHTHTITIHPDVKGTHWVRVEWSNHPIPGSPFTFEVSDHRNVAVYLPNPKETMLLIGKPFQFTVDPQRAGKGKIVVRAKLESGMMDSFNQEIQSDGKVLLMYEPKERGTMQLLLTFNGKNIIPDHFNPCIYEVVDPSTLEVIPPKGSGMLQRPIRFEITGLTERNKQVLAYKAMHTATKRVALIKVECPDGETAVAQFTPTKLGEYEVTAQVSEMEQYVKGSPFKISVADPEGCKITSETPQTIAVGSHEAITVDTAKAGPGEISFRASSLDDKPTNCIECELEATGPTQQQIILTGMRSGKCNLHLNWAGYSIPKMPVKITVVDPTKCIFLDPPPKYLHSGTPFKIRVSTKDAGPGDLNAHTSQPNILSATSKLVDEDSFMLQLSPTAVGAATVQLTLNKISVPHLAFSPVVVDASKCIVSSPALESRSWKCKHPLEFVVDATDAGDGELTVKVQSQKHPLPPEISKTSSSTYTVSFTSQKTGLLSIDILWCDVNVPGSPYEVEFHVDPSDFSANGKGLAHAIAMESAEFTLVGPESGLFDTGTLAVEITGHQLQSKVVERSQFDPKCGNLIMSITDNKDGTYFIQYVAPQPGNYILSITCDELPIPGSHFSITALARFPLIDPFMYKIYTIAVGSCEAITVDTAIAGPGEISFTASSLDDKPTNCIECELEATGPTQQQIILTGMRSGKCNLYLNWAGYSIPKMPIEITVVDPTKCIFLDPPPKYLHSGIPVEIRVSTKDAGPGVLDAHTSQPDILSATSKLVDEDSFMLQLSPTAVGTATVQLTLNKISVPHLAFSPVVVDASKCIVSSPALESSSWKCKHPLEFVVDATDAGDGELTVKVQSQKHCLPPEISKTSSSTYTVSFTSQKTGLLYIDILWCDVNVPGSPYEVEFHVDPSDFSANGKGLAHAIAMESAEFTLVGPESGLFDTGTLAVEITGHQLQSKVVERSQFDPKCGNLIMSITDNKDGTYFIQYVAPHPGNYILSITCDEHPIPGSPFSITALATFPLIDPFMYKIYTIAVGSREAITVDTAIAGPGEISFRASSLDDKPTNCIECELEVTGPTQQQIILTGMRSGKCNLHLNWAGYSIPKVPIEITVVDHTKCIFLDPPPKYLHSGTPVEIRVSTKDAGPGDLDAHTSQPDILSATSKLVDEDSFMLQLSPTAVGTATVQLTLNKISVPHLAFSPVVVDASKCIVSSPALESSSWKCKHPLEFVVDATDAGDGELTVKVQSQKHSLPPEISKTSSSTYTVSFTSQKTGLLSIDILWCDVNVPGSPYEVEFHVDPSDFSAKGKGLAHAIAMESAEFTLVGPESGLFDTGTLAVEITGHQLQSKVVERSQFDPKCGNLIMSITDNKDGTYFIQYVAPHPGKYTLSITCDELPIPGSPFSITALATFPLIDPFMYKIYTIAVGSREAITVDTAIAGPGEISFRASSLDDKPTNCIECELEATGPTQQQIILTGMRSGKCNLYLNWAGYSIPKRPIEITVVDPTKCIFLDPPPKYLHSGTPVEIRVSTKDAGPGILQLNAHTSQPNILGTKVNRVNDNSFVLQLSPSTVGSATVQLTLNKLPVPSSPFTVHVVDPSKCKLLDSIPATVQVGQSVKFKVDTQAAGAGELTMLFAGAEESPIVEHSIDKQESGTYEITLTGKGVGETKVELQWSGYTVPDSALHVDVCKTFLQSCLSIPKGSTLLLIALLALTVLYIDLILFISAASADNCKGLTLLYSRYSPFYTVYVHAHEHCRVPPQ